MRVSTSKVAPQPIDAKSIEMTSANAGKNKDRKAMNLKEELKKLEQIIVLSKGFNQGIHTIQWLMTGEEKIIKHGEYITRSQFSTLPEEVRKEFRGFEWVYSISLQDKEHVTSIKVQYAHDYYAVDWMKFITTKVCTFFKLVSESSYS